MSGGERDRVENWNDRDEAPAPVDVPTSPDYGRGVYRRRIHLRALAGGAEGELEDDFHHFAARVEHDGVRVVRARGRSIRSPWTTCPAAATRVRALAGLALDATKRETFSEVAPEQQCTHTLDAALLAIAQVRRHLAGGHAERAYEMALSDRREGRSRAELWCDGTRLLGWDLAGGRIEGVTAGPAGALGARLHGKEIPALAKHVDPDQAEALGALRRACFIGIGRQYDFDAIPRASHFAATVGSACYTFDPTRADDALRIVGSVRVFTDAPRDSLAGAHRDGLFEESE